MVFNMIDLSSLDKFQERVEKLANTNIKENVKHSIVNEATLILQGYYPHDTVSTLGKGDTFLIVATGNGLWFREFGTGFVGESSYPKDNFLPQRELSFTSYGMDWTTDGWVYHYNPITVARLGTNYGQVAQAGLFQTSERLKQNLPSIIRDALKGEEE